MFKDLFSALGRLYTFVMSLAVTAIVVAITWAFWTFYRDSQLQKQFAAEGQLRSVLVDQADQKQRSWRDIMSNSTYLSFKAQGKTYTSRYVMDSAFVGAGDRVQLLYHPKYDAFRQVRDPVHFTRSDQKSRLIQWTTVRDFTDEHRLLLFCTLLTTASFFLVTGLLATFLPVAFLQEIARLIFIAELAIGGLFFTYDVYQYFQYYQHLKAHGHEVSVRVMDTDRRSYTHGSSSDFWYSYEYEATIRYQQQERVIPISEDDFETLKKGDTLQALYDDDKSVNDFMSVDFPPDYSQVIIPGFFWLVVILLVRSTLSRFYQKQPPASR